MKGKYSVIVFDLGNVLLPFDYSDVIKGFNQIEEGLGMKFASYYRNNYEVHRKFERGEYTVEKFTEIMLDVLDRKMSKDVFYKVYSQIFTVNDKLVAVLPALNKNTFRSAVEYQRHPSGVWMEKLWIPQVFRQDGFISRGWRSQNSETEIYKTVEAFTKKAPQEHLYIDDILEYVSAARGLGWDAVQFVGNENLFDEFRKRGILFESNSVNWSVNNTGVQCSFRSW